MSNSDALIPPADDRPSTIDPPQSTVGNRLSLPKKLHLRSTADYDAVFAERTREARGPLVAHGKPNGLGHCRFGMSVSRKVGPAVRRNRVRRQLREAYRLSQHELPGGYDVAVVVRPHPPLELDDYRRMLGEIFYKLHRTWQRRPVPSPPGTPGGEG